MNLLDLLFSVDAARDFLRFVHGCAVYDAGNSLGSSCNVVPSSSGGRRTFRTLPFSCRTVSLDACTDDWLLRMSTDGSSFDVWWAVLGVLFSSSDACTLVMRETPEGISVPYFRDFHHRMSNFLFGTRSTSKLPAAVIVSFEHSKLQSLCAEIGL